MSENRALEVFLARLYGDAAALDRFAADPAGAARASGLPETMVAALAEGDITGLRMAAASYAWKRREHAASRRTSRLRRFANAVAARLRR